jgi:hypothetical protein
LANDPEKSEFCSGGSFDEESDENSESLPPKLSDWPNLDSLKLKFDRDPDGDGPKVEEFGRPNDAVDEGGGPAGVVDGLLKRLRDLSGVEGGLVSGTVKAILRGY